MSTNGPVPVSVTARERAQTPKKRTRRREIEPAAFKVPDAASYLGVSPRAIYDLIKASRLRYVRLAGGAYLIPKAMCDEFLAGE